MQLNVYGEMAPVWEELSKSYENLPDLHYKLDLQKQLLNFFQVGEYFYFIFNLRTSELEFLSPEATKVLGYDLDEITTPLLMSIIHPEDSPYFLNFGHEAAAFFGQLEHHQVPNYKASFDFRMRKKDGAYIRVLNQLKVIQFTDSKNILRALMLHTDISAIKTSGKPVLSFIGFNGEPSYIDVKATEKFPLPSQLLSDREREILALLIEGVESEAIAKELFISKETVNTHRRNILRKTGAANSAQLISKAIREGWV